MDLTTILPADFKTQFARNFAYLPIYNSAQLYNSGVVIYYPTTLLFYTCQVNGTIDVAPDSDPTKWVVTAGDINNYVQDNDITNAFAEAQVIFNQSFFPTDAVIKLAYLYLTAHYLVNDLKAALAGIGASAAFPVNSKTVGSVSESYSIPEAYLEDPRLAFYTSSAYGLKYLSMVLPNIVGNMQAIAGWTQAL